MVRSDIDLALDQPRYRPGDDIRAMITIVAARVGHFFPTYVTPKVVVRFALVDAAGATVNGSLEEHGIGREVALEGAGRGTAGIHGALDAARRSAFEIWRQEIPLT